MIREKWGRSCAAHYLGAGELTDAGYAPGRGRLDGLPPTIVHIGKREVLYEQVLEFAGNLRAAGVELRLTEFPRLWHVGHVTAGVLPESREAVEELGEFLRRKLDRVGVLSASGSA